MKIDTNTTAGKIALMQAYEDGKELEFKNHKASSWEYLESGTGIYPAWDWLGSDYRIKPQTVEEAAKECFNQVQASEPMAGVNWIEEIFISGVKWRDENPKEES